MNRLASFTKHIDWTLFFATIPILGAGLVTMNSFTGDSYFFSRQVIWIVAAIIVFFAFSLIDFRFLRRSGVIVGLFLGVCIMLMLLFVSGHVSKGAQSWFRIGFLSIQPSDPAKIILILVLAKYFSRRHVEIAHIRHILVSGFYAFIVFILVLLQPDFGSAIIIFLIWFGMVLVSGISKKHLVLVIAIGLLAFGGLWMFAFKDYQKQRIITFINPLTDIRGSGYNAYQSMIAVGSGQLLGKGVGYGTQSKLKFLPEHQTDFIFAAFAEEWGFVGSTILFMLYGIIVWRVIINAMRGAGNFEILYAMGIVILLITHFIINIGMNIGLMPVTGVVLPFMSYGGSHVLTEFAALGILMGMRRYGRVAHKDIAKNEIIGV
jgi:rod shape determining protein RodA